MSSGDEVGVSVDNDNGVPDYSSVRVAELKKSFVHGACAQEEFSQSYYSGCWTTTTTKLPTPIARAVIPASSSERSGNDSDSE